jgi:CheY-like chemotaxis protein
MICFSFATLEPEKFGRELVAASFQALSAKITSETSGRAICAPAQVKCPEGGRAVKMKSALSISREIVARRRRNAPLTHPAKNPPYTTVTRKRQDTCRAGRMSTIVIYEDDDLMRALLEEWLSDAGYRVLADASHDLHGGSLADLVIVSVYMPKHAGARLVRKIQAMHPETPLIAISGQFLPGLSANGAIAQMLGVQQVLAKPLSRIDLLRAVRAVIGVPA